MKARSAALQGALAVIGLVAAYLTWQRPKDTVKGEQVTVLDVAKNALDQVRFEDGVRSLTLEKKKDHMVLTMAYLPGQKPAWDAGIELVALDGGVDGGAQLANTRMPEPLPERTVYANERANDVWAKLTPFVATRALGVLSAEKHDEVGLTETDRRLELTVGGQPISYRISKPQKGLIGLYAENEKTHEVFLISSSLFNELDPHAQVLVERKLHDFKSTDYDGFTVKSGGKEAAFVQTGAEIAERAKVARAATPDQPDELTKNWHDKVWARLIVTEVLGKDELPKAGEPEVVVRLEYTAHGAPKGWLELAQDPKGSLWARSENTLGWVGIHQGGEDLLIEATKIVSGR